MNTPLEFIATLGSITIAGMIAATLTIYAKHRFDRARQIKWRKEEFRRMAKIAFQYDHDDRDRFALSWCKTYAEELRDLGA